MSGTAMRVLGLLASGAIVTASAVTFVAVAPRPTAAPQSPTFASTSAAPRSQPEPTHRTLEPSATPRGAVFTPAPQPTPTPLVPLPSVTVALPSVAVPSSQGPLSSTAPTPSPTPCIELPPLVVCIDPPRLP